MDGARVREEKPRRKRGERATLGHLRRESATAWSGTAERLGRRNSVLDGGFLSLRRSDHEHVRLAEPDIIVERAHRGPNPSAGSRETNAASSPKSSRSSAKAGQ